MKPRLQKSSSFGYFLGIKVEDNLRLLFIRARCFELLDLASIEIDNATITVKVGDNLSLHVGNH